MNNYTEKKANNLRDYKWKMGLVYFFIIALGIACFLKIAHLVIFQRSLYTGTSSECLDKTKEGWEKSPLANDPDCNCFVLKRESNATRGDIYDDQGRILASNRVVFDVVIDGKYFFLKNENFYAYPDSLQIITESLANQFYAYFKDRFPARNYEYYLKKIKRAIYEKKNSVILSSNPNRETQWITHADTLAINHFAHAKKIIERGLNYPTQSVRINPYGDIAKRTIGINTDIKSYGIEKHFNHLLRGETREIKYLRVNNASIPLEQKMELTDGYNVHTTLNLEIQQIVHNELQNTLINQNAEWGCAIVMETQTGEVKAISNLMRVTEGSYSESNDYALNAMVEPGSTFKLASLLAYLDHYETEPNRTYPIHSHTFIIKNRAGTKEYKYPKTDKGFEPQELVAPIEVFQRSSNVGISSMIFDAFTNKGYLEYRNKLDSMFITTSYSTQLGTIQKPAIKPNLNDFNVYYNACFGTGFKMTPIQTLTYFNAVANNGKLLVPLFVKYITNNEDTIAEFKAEVLKEQICKPKTIARAKQFLEAVVNGEHGTAHRYNSPQFSFAGKTGTRDMWDDNTQKYNKSRNTVSFCGYFPAENPKYTCLVFIYNVATKSSIAVELFTKIGKNIMNIANYSILQTVEHSDAPSTNSFYTLSLQDYNTIFESLEIPQQTNTPNTPYIFQQKKEVKPVIVSGKEKVPNVNNMNAADAVYELSKAGYKVELMGKGIVKKQIYNQNNNTVMIFLETG